MIQKLQAAFTDHPASVDETFIQHMTFALGFSVWLFLAASAALIHALLPFMCEKTAGNIINRLHTRIHARRG